MPEIDLEPHEYADRDPKSGKWRRPLSKRVAKWWCLFALALLGVAFVARDTGRSDVTFGLTAMFAFFAGVFAQQWLRDLY